MDHGSGFPMLDKRSMQTALLIGAFVLSYNCYVLSAYKSFMQDPFVRKVVIYSIMGGFSFLMMFMGNSNNKSKREISFRKVGAFTLAISNVFIMLTQYGLLVRPVQTIIIFNVITFLLVIIFIFKADKNGNI